MKRKLTFIFSIFYLVCQGQSVQFLNNNLQGAISIAQNKNKLVFVDTYAPWCVPCKKMEKVFRDPELAAYFNQNFVNVRIDMDGPTGKEVHRNYQVIFLPTLMILDQEGRVKYKVDREMSAKNLLDIAQKIAQPEIYAVPKQTEIVVANPVVKDKVVTEPVVVNQEQPKEAVVVLDVPVEPDLDTKPIHPETEEEIEVDVIIAYDDQNQILEGTISEEKILHVFDKDAENLPPEILRQEAYLALQLMDGSHISASRKFINTQTDWDTEDNIRFIYDFLHTTDSREFQHMLNNRDEYEKIIGKDRVYQTISILVYDRLDRGFPRPTFEETKDLFSYLDTKNFEKLTYEHHTESLYSRKIYGEFEEKAKEYLRKINPKNDQMWYRLALIQTQENNNISEGLASIGEAIKYNPHNFQYFDTQAYLYYLESKKELALISAYKAKTLAEKNGQDLKNINILIDMIKEDLD